MPDMIVQRQKQTFFLVEQQKERANYVLDIPFQLYLFFEITLNVEFGKVVKMNQVVPRKKARRKLSNMQWNTLTDVDDFAMSAAEEQSA